MKVCRICLSEDGRLYPLTSNGLSLLYHHLVIIPNLHEKVRKILPQWVCAECGLRLLSYNKLREKGLRTHQLLCGVLSRSNYTLTEDALKQIDREKNNLKSNFTQHSVNIDYNIIEESVNTEGKELKCKNTTKIDEFVIKLELDETLTHDNAKKSPKSDVKTSLLGEFLKFSDNESFSKCSDVESFSKSSDIESLSKSSNSDDSDPISNLEDASDISELSDASLYDLASYTNLELLCDSSNSSLSENRQTQGPEAKKERQQIKKKVDAFINTLKKKNTKTKAQAKTKLKDTQTKIDTKNSVKKKVQKKQNVSKDPYTFEEMFTVQKFSFDEQREQIESRKKTQNYIDSPLKCDLCFRGFGCEETFKRHQLRHTDKWGKFECTICKRRFPSKGLCRNHMSTHKVMYSCKLCKYTASSRCIALNHGLIHKGKSSHQCPHCGIQFAVTNTFMTHLRIKHVSKFACEICGYSYVTPRGLQQHKNLKHRALDNTVVTIDGPECTTCDIRFVSDEAFNTHLRVAHPQTPNEKLRNDDVQIRLDTRLRDCEFEMFPCNICGKEFNTSSNRTRHKDTVHLTTRPFLCKICGSNFKSKADVKLHTKHVHHKVPWPKKNARVNK